MTKKIIYALSYSFLFFACAEDRQTPSDQLEINKGIGGETRWRHGSRHPAACRGQTREQVNSLST